MKNLLCVSVFLALGCSSTLEQQQAQYILRMRMEIEAVKKHQTALAKQVEDMKQARDAVRPKVAPAPVSEGGDGTFAGRLIQPLPAGFEMYLGEPPFGWGNNAVSVSFTNAVPGCYMELIVAGQPGRVLMRSGSAIGEFPGTLYSVQDSQGDVDPASLIPPGETVYFLRDTPGYQSWIATCYVNIPRLVQVSTAQGVVRGLVLQVTSRRPGAFFGGKASVRVNSYDMYDISRFN